MASSSQKPSAPPAIFSAGFGNGSSSGSDSGSSSGHAVKKSKTALLLVDVQDDFYSGNAQIRAAFPDFPAKVSKLLSVCRAVCGTSTAAATAGSSNDGGGGDHVDGSGASGFDDAVTTSVSSGFEIVHIRARYSEADSAWLPTFTRLNPDKGGETVRGDAEPFAIALEGEKIVSKTTFDGFLGTDLDAYLREKSVERVLVAGLVTSACVLMTLHGAFARGYETALVRDCCGDRTTEKHEAICGIYGGYMCSLVTLEDVQSWLGQ